MSKRAIIIGAGPAGLTAAYELLERTDIIPIIIEKSGDIGGISKTINYKGNRMDMGPQRFFFKSAWVRNWLLKIIPLAERDNQQNKIRVFEDPCSYIMSDSSIESKNCMLMIPRITRDYQDVRPLKGKLKRSIFRRRINATQTEKFLYPKWGAGSFWEEIAQQIEAKGGKIYIRHIVQSIYAVKDEICSIHTINTCTGELALFEGDFFFSSMPVQEFIADLEVPVPQKVREIAAGLQYRDLINVGILLRQMSSSAKEGAERQRLELKDNWIYIQERDVKVGQLIIYNNLGSGMIKDPNTTWIGMEYFCDKTDDFWALEDDVIGGISIMELEEMDLAGTEDILDITVQRMEKTYPTYFGTYEQFPVLQEYISRFSNLFLVGCNGMHKYNNADHSILTAKVSVDNIIAGVTTKENIWAINTEQEDYGEKRTPVDPQEESNQEPSAKRPANAPQFELLPSLQYYFWRNKRNRAYVLTALGIFLLLIIYLL